MTGRLQKFEVWTADEIELARRLWCDGVEMADLRKALVKAGYPPRTGPAILKKREALGWPQRGDRRKVAVHKPGAPDVVMPAGSVGAKAPGKRRLAPPRIVVSNPAPRSSGPGTHLMDLRLGSCRWPLWPDRGRTAFEDMRFCGEPVARIGAPYCPACAAKASGGRIEAHMRPEPRFRLARMGGGQ